MKNVMMKLKNKLLNFYRDHESPVNIILTIILGSLFLMTTGFVVFKTIMFISDFLVVVLLGVIVYQLGKILNILRDNINPEG